IFAAQMIKPQARVLAGDRGIDCDPGLRRPARHRRHRIPPVLTSHPQEPSMPPVPHRVDLALRGSAVLDQGVVPDALLLITAGTIIWAGPATHAPAHRAEQSRTHEGLILPGLVDLHCHGGGGASFPDSPTAQEMLTAIREHRLHGTTSIVASLVTADAATLRAQVGELASLWDQGEIAAIHLEGPF